MKTGKTIVRVLAVILLLSMLVGFTPAMPAASQDDGGAVVLADPVDGEDNGDTGDTGSGDTGDVPGETGGGNTDTGEGGGTDTGEGGGTDTGEGGGTDSGEGGSTTPGEGGSTEPEVKKVAVTFDGNVTVKAGDAAIESGAEVEVGTKLAITVKTENVASAILVNDKECKGEYAVSDKDEAVNITAFGVTKTSVAPDGWTKGDKTVTISTFGENVTVNGKASSGTVTFTQSENGTFEADVKCGDVSVKVPVKVEQIDKTAPAYRASGVFVESRGLLTAKCDYTIPVVEEGSGFDKNDVTISGTYVVDGKEKSLEKDTIDDIMDGLRVRDNVITFTAPSYIQEHKWVNGRYGPTYTRFRYDIEYTVTVKDKVGNSVTKTLSELLEEKFNDSDDESGGIHDSQLPEILEAAFEPSYMENLYTWIGPDSTLTLSLRDTSGKWAPQAELKEIQFINYDTKEVIATAVPEITKDELPRLIEATACFKEGTFKDLEDGSYQIVVRDSENETIESFDIKVDRTAPSIQSVTLDQNVRTAYQNVVHALTGGVMFKEQVAVTVTLNEEEISEVEKIVCSFDGVEQIKELPGGFNVSEDGLTYTFNVQLPKADTEEIEKGEKGMIEVKLIDKVANVSDSFKVTYVPPTEDGSGEAADAIFDNSGTTYDNGKLTVFAYHTPDGEDAPIPYTGDWTKSVEFDVRYDLDEVREAEMKKQPTDRDLTADDEWYEVDHKNITLKTDVDGDLESSADPSKPVEQEDGVWKVVYGKNGKVACNGKVTFTVTSDILLVHYVTEVDEWEQVPVTAEDGSTTLVDKLDENGNKIPKNYKKKLDSGNNFVVKETQDISVPVKVQNYMDPAVISVNDKAVSGAIDAWFNGLDNQLGEVQVKAPLSKAPFTTTYELIYAPISGEESSKPGEITVSGSNEKLRSQIDQDGLYKVVAKTTDTVGLNLSAKTDDVSFKYDVTPANIYVTFATEQESHKDANGKFYDEQRTARVTIMDDTFTDEDKETVKDYEQFVVEILKTYGEDAQLSKDWAFTPNSDGKGGQWKCEYTYGVKGGDAKRDGDNYQVTVAVTDKAGNTSATDKQGAITRNNVKDEKELSHYTSVNGELFTVDQTAPVVSVSYNNNNVRNGKYFNASRTATITVVEHNFDPARVTLTATGASAGATASEGWTQNGDTWTKTVTFGRDANCKFSIDIVDKAGNVCPNANVKYSGAATADFVIDLTRPNVQYTGVDASPYAAACTPGFTATDTNLGNEFTYKLTRKTMKGEEDVSNLLNHAGSAARFSYSDIPNNRDDDGIYTLTCSVTDLAGNVTTLNPVEFAVNRHGSVYLLNDDLQGVVGKYFNEDGWNKVNDNNLVITEYNPTQLKDDAKLEIYRDGTRVASYTGEALKKLVSGGNRGSLGLYEYAYKLPADDFAEDGSYRVVLSSTDANDHKSGNDKTGAEINFVIDTVSPEIVSISGLEKRTVNAEEQPVGFHILDTYGLDSVAIRTAGPDGAIVKEYISQAKYDAQNGKLEPYQQLLPEGELDLTDEITLLQNNTPYHVVISVTDKAGNTTVADGGSIVSSTEAEAMTPSYDFQDSVTVSTNFFVRYIHNTGALVGTGVGAAALAGLWLVLAKRKKDDEEKKTA